MREVAADAATLDAGAGPAGPAGAEVGASAGAPAVAEGPSGLGRAAAVTAGLTAAGSLLGLLRDQTIAHLFGAGAASDAFLVSWTVPELAATVLIEDAMALLLVPAFSTALARRGARRRGEPADPVRALLAATLPRLTLLLAVATVALGLAAPTVVHLLAPGLPNPALAIDCTRLTAVSVFTFGLTGYLSAALRAHRRYLPPAAIYVAYNVGIVTTLLATHARWGVRAAAAGVAVGGVLMVLVQLPFFVLQLRTPKPGGHPTRRAAPQGPTSATERLAPRGPAGAQGSAFTPEEPAPQGPAYSPEAAAPKRSAAPPEAPAPQGQAAPPEAPAPLPEAAVPRPRGGGFSGRGPGAGPGLALVAPVIVFTVSRQAQVLIERFFAASLPSGAISHLNYAQKVAQMPMMLSLIICTVTFPVVSQALAEGDRERARRRVERDLALACVVVMLGMAFVIACAPQIIELLFQRGAFTPSDTAATAAVMRVYALGLLGQSLVGALVRPYFSAARPTWYPAAAMAVGLAVTVAADAAGVGAWGIYGIAAGNAAGITVTAALLVHGLGAQTIAIGARQLTAGVGRIMLAAAAATATGWCLAAAITDPLAAVAACCVAVPAAFTATAAAVRVPEVPYLLATVKRKLSHAH